MRTDEAFIGTPESVVKCRFVRRRSTEHKWNPEALRNTVGVPRELILLHGGLGGHIPSRAEITQPRPRREAGDAEDEDPEPRIRR